MVCCENNFFYWTFSFGFFLLTFLYDKRNAIGHCITKKQLWQSSTRARNKLHFLIPLYEMSGFVRPRNTFELIRFSPEGLLSVFILVMWLIVFFCYLSNCVMLTSAGLGFSHGSLYIYIYIYIYI